MEQENDDLNDLIRLKGHKLTPQRKAILAILTANQGNPLTPEAIYGIIKNNKSKVGLTTVYRTLNLLQQIGVVNHFHFHEGCDRYEVISKRHHHYLICLRCGKAQPTEVCFARDIRKEVEKTIDFTVTDHCLSLFGYCADCRGET